MLAVKRGAIGELECDKAIEVIGQTTNKLESAVLFSAAGQLVESEKEFPVAQAAVNEALKEVTAAASQFGTSVSGSQEEVGGAAKSLAQTMHSLGGAIEQLASIVKDPAQQQEVISRARVVVAAGADLIEAGKITFRRGDAESVKDLQKSGKEISKNIAKLVDTIQKAAQESQRGKKLLQRDAAAVLELAEKYDTLPANGTAEPEDVVLAARALDAANSRLVTAYGTKDPEQMIEASKAVRAAAVNLFATGKVVSVQTPKKEVQAALKQSLAGTAGAVAHFLTTTANAVESKKESGAALSQTADGARATMPGIVAVLNKIPGGEGLKFEEDTAEDLESVAEKELLAAARAIEAAAKTLSSSARRSEMDYTNASIRVGDEEINESILQAARIITMATARLIKAAAKAQADRRRTVKEQGTRYHADPAWANGLISAAKEVAGTTQALVVAANRSVVGEAEEVELVATARAVAAATAQLTTASKVKASNPNADSQLELEDAAKQVAGSTSALVTCAKEVTAHREAKALEEGRAPRFKTGKVAEMEEQVNILRLETELEGARKELARRRKARYNR